MPRSEPTPLRWVDEAETRRLSERALLVHDGAEQMLQIRADFVPRRALSALSLFATILSMLLAAPFERLPEWERGWHDPVI